MKFVKIPSFPSSEKELQDFKDLVFLPKNIGAFYRKELVAGTIPSDGSSIKPWRDNATVWNPGKETFEYIFQKGTVELKIRSLPGDAGNQIVDAEGITELEGTYSGKAIKFYLDRFLKSGGKDFAKIPKLVKVELSRAEAKRLNLSSAGSPLDNLYPVALPFDDSHIKTTLNPNVAFRFNDGVVEGFDIDEYDKAFPIDANSSGLSDQELIDSVVEILASPLSLGEKAKAIRLITK
jgi:hypothetical protein